MTPAESNPLRAPSLVAVACILAGCTTQAGTSTEPARPPASPYHIYEGNTHSHTFYTWSHGAQWVKNRASRMRVINSVSYPGSNAVLKPDWQKLQGPPSKHFALAKANGFDFYVVTDHSQEAAFQPVSPTNAAWVATGREAAQATDSHFVALRGFEYSENNGPGGRGHINVINSADYLNALSPGIDLPYLYRWLKTVPPNGDGPVVASFNHPGARQYQDWAGRDPQITGIITMLEVINSDRATHYKAFVNALDKGWKVSPIAGLDNHGLSGIRHLKSRTFVLATQLTKTAILDAMKHRRTYAALDSNIQCRYTVNDAIMGSTLKRPNVFHFDIAVSDPDTGRPRDKITRIDIVKDRGVVVRTYRPSPGFSIHWSPTIQDSRSRYFFVRVWSAGGGDVATADPAKPVAWLAPVWTGR